MYGVPNATKPPKSTATKVLLIVGVTVCLAAGTGITILGVQFASGPAIVAQTTTPRYEPTPVPTSTARPSPGNGGPHKMPSDLCAPLKTIETTPPLANHEAEAPKDYTYFSAGRCSADSEKYEVNASVDLQVNYDSENIDGEEFAGKGQDAGERVYGKKPGYQEVSGVGDRAFAAPVTESDDSSWHLEVQDANLNLRVTARTEGGKEASLALAKEIAQKYLDAAV